MNNVKKIKLNIGCGIRLVKNFINIDNYFSLGELEEGIKTKKGEYQDAQIPKGVKFIQASVLNLPFKDNYVDYIECVDMIEHIPFRSVELALWEMRRVLKVGGEIRIMTTNFDNLSELWFKQIKEKPLDISSYFNIMEIIYGNQWGNGEFHLSAFNPKYINYLFGKVGFKNLKVTIYPQYCTSKPDLETLLWRKNFAMRSEMMLAIANK